MLPPFWTLVEAHGDELLVHARRLAGDAAEDVLQDALLRALRAYPQAAPRRAPARVAVPRDHHDGDRPSPRAAGARSSTDEPPVVATYDTYDDGASRA